MIERTYYRVISFGVMAGLMTAIALMLAPSPSYGKYSHLERINNSEGCVACHSGRGAAGSGLLHGRSEALCYKCHGESSSVKGRPAQNIQREMGKISAHPVAETSHLHRMGEELPAKAANQPRHVSCQDCHLVHITTKNKPFNGVRGYNPGVSRGLAGSTPLGLSKRNADYEYEMCYLCHSQGANMDFDDKDISIEFAPSNASFHPVEGRGRNLNVPSLVRPLRETSTLTCSSCHSSDDPAAPSGPHGSSYEPLLFANYNKLDGPEGLHAYALCYKCHDRDSILSNESFKAHREHVALRDLACGNCHNAHGSELNRNLIEFDSIDIGPASDGLGPMYIDDFSGRPKCYLSCHGIDHNSKDVNGQLWKW